ncbi:MAG: peptidylprolyl isomerase [Spirochaetae bacterium HGW-Spirochaetae-8]|nr:MAG: peptidylprolyl isomerase [Spirochaetae bacterium HGW-Spirochaetae-8]
MVRKAAVCLFIVLLVSTTTLLADVISEPAATVNLIRNTVISVESLNEKVKVYQEQIAKDGSSEKINPLDVLNVMINDELVLQGAERDGYIISEAQVDQLVKQQKAYVEQQVKTSITDAQFEQVLLNNYGMDLAAFRKNLKESALVDSYVRGTQAAVLQNYSEPTDSEIMEFHRANRSAFINPELVRISHIFMPFTETDKDSVKVEMDKLARWLRYNTYTFEELVPKYSKDTASINKGGDIGWLAFDDTSMRGYLGDNFFNAVFELQLGKPSGVLESTGGFHIVKVTTHIDPKMLAIDDVINPESTVTVRQYIQQNLLSRNQQTAYLQGINTLVESLRKSALIDILYK